MKKSVFYPFFLIFSLICSGVLFGGYRINTGALQAALLDRETARSLQVLEGIKAVIDAEVDKIAGFAKLLAADTRLFPETSDRAATPPGIGKAAKTIQAELGVSLFEITGAGGRLIYSGDMRRDPGMFSDLWGIDEALAGEKILAASRTMDGWGVWQLVPLESETGVVGTVSVGFEIDRNLVNKIASATNVSLTITTIEEVVAGDKNLLGPSPERVFSSDFWARIAEGNRPLFVEDAPSRRYTMFAAVRVVDETFCLVIRTDTSPMYALLSRKKADLRVAFAGSLALAIVGCLLATRYIARPLKRLQNKADALALRFSKGRPDRRAEGNEIQRLSIAFDAMSEEIAAAMSDRDRSESALRKSEKQYRLLAENASDVIWVLDVDGLKYRYISPSVQRLLQYTPEELMSAKIDRAVTTDSWNYIQHRFSERMEAFRQGHSESHVDEIEQVRKDGTRVWTEVVTRYSVNESDGKVELYGISRNINERKRAEKEKNDLVRDLQAALSEVKVLSGFLPICAHCKKIRDDNGYWNQIENYIKERSEADFSHSICPDCARQLYPDLDMSKW